MTPYDRALNMGTEIVITCQTRVARQAAVRRPTDADALANLEPFGYFTKGHHRSYRFVAGDKRIRGHTPVVVEHGKIGMANPTMAHLDFDLLMTEFTGIEFERLQGAAGSVGGVSVKCWHVDFVC